MKQEKRVFWINLKYAVFCIESENDLIAAAAPIADWMIGKTLQEVKPWLKKKRAIVKELKVKKNEQKT